MPETPTPTTAALLSGRYRLLSLVAAGGSATVHEARDEVLDRRVAIKILRSDLAANPVLVDRFRREALAAAKMSHPHVVTLYDVADDGTYLVMEFVDGVSLRHLLDKRGRLRPGEALALLGPAAAGVSAAHAAGLVHRDVKPENVLLANDGTVKIGDFGLARATATASTTHGPDHFAGTARYAAPEAVRGERLDARTDVYALGIMLFECLTGRPPFDGDSHYSITYQHAHSRVPRPSSLLPHLSRDVDEVVMRATDPDPDGRYPDAGAFARALHDAVPDGPAAVDLRDGESDTVILPVDVNDTVVTARQEPEDGGAPRRRRRWPLALLALVLLAAGGWLGYDRLLFPTIEIPSVTGDSVAVAAAALEDAGFTVTQAADPVSDRDVPAGMVLGTEPDGQARRGATVTVLVSAGPRQVLVPATAGQDEALALERLEDEGLEVTVSYEFDEQVPAGLAVGTTPPSGETIDETTPVTLVVSKGREPIVVPEVLGAPEGDAVATLKELGLVPVITARVDSREIPAGHVVTQSPSSGRLFRGDQVELTVSLGAPKFAMPDVTGRREAKAVAILEERGLKVTIEYMVSEQRAGIVHAQDPDPGRSVRPGDTVTLFVWKQAG